MVRGFAVDITISETPCATMYVIPDIRTYLVSSFVMVASLLVNSGVLVWNQKLSVTRARPCNVHVAVN